MVDPSSGGLTPVTGSPFPVPVSPLTVAIDPSGKFAYVTSDSSNGVLIYGINPTSGALTASGMMATRGGPVASTLTRGTTPLAYIPQFAYAPASSNILAYSIDPM